MTFGILIHGGAGPGRIDAISARGKSIRTALLSSARSGFEILAGSGSAVDAVEAAVVSMEDCGLFNAGAGSCLTVDRQVEMDASIMDGRDLSAGSVGMVTNVKNPVKLARAVMERTDHAMMVSGGAADLARILGIEQTRYSTPSADKLETFDRLVSQMKDRWKRNYKLMEHGTVGSVAIDRKGNVASAVSTGGRWLKLHGRVGDSAIIGAGIYADNSLGAACATGDGELIMRLCLCKFACDGMKARHTGTGAGAASRAIALLTGRFGRGTGGMISVDRKGRFDAATNTDSMPVALVTATRPEARREMVAINADEIRRLF